MITGSEIKVSVKSGILVFVEISALGILLIVTCTLKGTSQTCCSGGVPLGGSLGLGSADKKSFQLLLTYDYNAINDLVSFSEKLNDDTRSRTTQSSIIEINYGINDKISVAGVLPFIKQTRKINAFEGENFTATQGIGDVVLLLKYRIIKSQIDKQIDWVIGAGPKFPTAKTKFKNNLGLILPADMQPGSGSWDGIFWSYLQKGRLLKYPNLSLQAAVSYRYSGANHTYNETQSYKFGDEFQLNLGANYNFFARWYIDVFSFIRYRYQAADLLNDSVFPSSGGKWIYVIPGLNIGPSEHWSFRISGDIPIVRKLAGTQLTTAFKINAAVWFNIPYGKNDIN